jgi:hypothetical protein
VGTVQTENKTNRNEDESGTASRISKIFG